MNPKEIRIKKKMTQLEMADYMGVTTRTIQNWESEFSFPNDAEIEYMKKAKKIKKAIAT